MWKNWANCKEPLMWFSYNATLNRRVPSFSLLAGCVGVSSSAITTLRRPCNSYRLFTKVVRRYAYFMVIKVSVVNLFPFRQENLCAADTRETPFIRALVTVVCEDTMDISKLPWLWVCLFCLVQTFFYLLVFFCYLQKKTEDSVNATLVA